MCDFSDEIDEVLNERYNFNDSKKIQLTKGINYIKAMEKIEKESYIGAYKDLYIKNKHLVDADYLQKHFGVNTKISKLFENVTFGKAVEFILMIVFAVIIGTALLHDLFSRL